MAYRIDFQTSEEQRLLQIFFWVDGPTIAWPNGADIAPETLYETVAVKTDSNRNSGVQVEWMSRFKTRPQWYRVWGGGRDDVWAERLSDSAGWRALEGAIQLVFGRTFEGWSGSDRTYFEVNQEYTHITGIHWRPEQRGYCRFDPNGDLQQVVSVTSRSDTVKDVLCVSFAWAPLEEYLAATNSTLVRRFDFTLLRRDNFTKWPEGPETVIQESDQLFYRQKVDPAVAAYTTGVQLIAPRRPYRVIFDDLRGGHKDKRYVEFIAHDWRNKRVATISTDPKATTNYFEAHGNSLPFEVSPAFFRPDVILKYKTDKDKYTVGERHITCRAAWQLQALDVNEAGQVFAYIRYLRNLPYAEQLHWRSYNEPPKAGISERAMASDFEGRFTTFKDPLREVLSIVRYWHETSVPWWRLRGDRLLERVSTPLTASRDEWDEAFMDLAKLVVEGFEVSAIRARLEKSGIAYEQKEQSIALLEHLINKGAESTEEKRLTGLRTVQLIRTKVTCENHLEPVLGVFWIGPDSFPYDYKEVAARIFGLDEESLRVHSVIPGQPAAAAGLRQGDAILKIGDTRIRSYKSWYSLTKVQHAQNLIRNLGKNPIDLELRRGSEILSVKVDAMLACRYPVDLVMSDRVNAFTNGDQISITTGMLRFIKGDDELALVIGHEIAHNALNHVGRMRGIGTIGGVAGILLDVGMAAAGVQTGGMFSRAGLNVARLVFSKEFEMESDYLGLHFAARAGFDISKASNFFRRMAVEHPGSITETFLSSHPSSPERSVAMEGTVKEIQSRLQAGEPLIPRRIDGVKSKNSSENDENEQRLQGE